MNLEIVGEIITFTSIILVIIATLSGFMGRWHWRLELFSHFRVQYLYLLIGFSFLSLILNSIVITCLGIVFALINLGTILPLFIPQRSRTKDNKAFRILLSNILRPNEHYEKLRQLIRTTNPDVIVIIEISQVWLQELESELLKYRYTHTAMRTDNYGIALFSHFKLSDLETIYFSDAKVPSLVAFADIHGCPLTIIATHPPPPKSRGEAVYRNQQLQNIASFAASQKNPCLLLGDLNLTSWSPHFQDLVHESGLRDSRQGFGTQPTWPTDRPMFMVPVDHLLISDGITVHDRFTGPRVGSDHLPVITDLSVDACNDKVTDVR